MFEEKRLENGGHHGNKQFDQGTLKYLEKIQDQRI